ncbi:MAG: hypothetical protein GTN86_13870 [Xanthomonadales bacterium]|nr:hypothetical protein [Xanthomonadales bacterium]NIN60796.1 hypothetical protein [Xanthomonadales bacterium]NIN76158.1 hypothetical protein [Xanthomonadales bacterium]NIO15379.1 hypothetical protein [Xanthomonadales bacterium]NIP13189.1 hypothetical protein [Xanthomonadales bacterium]
MLHPHHLEREPTLRAGREAPAAQAVALPKPSAAEAEPAISPWALAAAVAGNVLAGGFLLGVLLMAPLMLQRVMSLL